MAALLEAARTVWPGVAVEPKQFSQYLRARADVSDLKDPARVGNLYLACACALGDKRALALFEVHYAPLMRAALAKMRFSAAQIDDALQILRQRLFVGEAGGQPKLAEYAGRGDLANWVRIVAMRFGVDLKRMRSDHLAENDQIFETLTTDDDPELEYIKDKYRPAFKEAFKEALKSLEPREQNLLRQHFLDHMSIDQLGPLYRVHRSTAARWLENAQAELLKRTRSSLMKRTRASRSQCDSIMREVHSRLDITLHSLFK